MKAFHWAYYSFKERYHSKSFNELFGGPNNPTDQLLTCVKKSSTNFSSSSNCFNLVKFCLEYLDEVTTRKKERFILHERILWNQNEKRVMNVVFLLYHIYRVRSRNVKGEVDGKLESCAFFKFLFRQVTVAYVSRAMGFPRTSYYGWADKSLKNVISYFFDHNPKLIEEFITSEHLRPFEIFVYLKIIESLTLKENSPADNVRNVLMSLDVPQVKVVDLSTNEAETYFAICEVFYDRVKESKKKVMSVLRNYEKGDSIRFFETLLKMLIPDFTSYRRKIYNNRGVKYVKILNEIMLKEKEDVYVVIRKFLRKYDSIREKVLFFYILKKHVLRHSDVKFWELKVGKDLQASDYFEIHDQKLTEVVPMHFIFDVVRPEYFSLEYLEWFLFNKLIEFVSNESKSFHTEVCSWICSYLRKIRTSSEKKKSQFLSKKLHDFGTDIENQNPKSVNILMIAKFIYEIGEGKSWTKIVDIEYLSIVQKVRLVLLFGFVSGNDHRSRIRELSYFLKNEYLEAYHKLFMGHSLEVYFETLRLTTNDVFSPTCVHPKSFGKFILSRDEHFLTMMNRVFLQKKGMVHKIVLSIMIDFQYFSTETDKDDVVLSRSEFSKKFMRYYNVYFCFEEVYQLLCGMELSADPLLPEFPNSEKMDFLKNFLHECPTERNWEIVYDCARSYWTYLSDFVVVYENVFIRNERVSERAKFLHSILVNCELLTQFDLVWSASVKDEEVLVQFDSLQLIDMINNLFSLVRPSAMNVVNIMKMQFESEVLVSFLFWDVHKVPCYEHNKYLKERTKTKDHTLALEFLIEKHPRVYMKMIRFLTDRNYSATRSTNARSVFNKDIQRGVLFVLRCLVETLSSWLVRNERNFSALGKRVFEILEELDFVDNIAQVLFLEKVLESFWISSSIMFRVLKPLGTEVKLLCQFGSLSEVSKIVYQPFLRHDNENLWGIIQIVMLELSIENQIDCTKGWLSYDFFESWEGVLNGFMKFNEGFASELQKFACGDSIAFMKPKLFCRPNPSEISSQDLVLVSERNTFSVNVFVRCNLREKNSEKYRFKYFSERFYNFSSRKVELEEKIMKMIDVAKPKSIFKGRESVYFIFEVSWSDFGTKGIADDGSESNEEQGSEENEEIEDSESYDQNPTCCEIVVLSIFDENFKIFPFYRSYAISHELGFSVPKHFVTTLSQFSQISGNFTQMPRECYFHKIRGDHVNGLMSFTHPDVKVEKRIISTFSPLMVWRNMFLGWIGDYKIQIGNSYVLEELEFFKNELHKEMVNRFRVCCLQVESGDTSRLSKNIVDLVKIGENEKVRSLIYDDIGEWNCIKPVGNILPNQDCITTKTKMLGEKFLSFWRVEKMEIVVNVPMLPQEIFEFVIFPYLDSKQITKMRCVSIAFLLLVDRSATLQKRLWDDWYNFEKGQTDGRLPHSEILIRQEVLF